VQVRPLTEAHAKAIAGWRYAGRYSTYDVKGILTPAGGYWAVVDDGELVGYCCFGPPARVPGVDEENDTLDVGYGMRPDLVGQGRGREFVSAVLAFAVERFAPPRLRLLVLTWNERSRRVGEALGFEQERVASSIEGDFLVLVRKGAARG
jgi:[ribosomal protein S18]-alanine N-acetyltransferase